MQTARNSGGETRNPITRKRSAGLLLAPCGLGELEFLFLERGDKLTSVVAPGEEPPRGRNSEIHLARARKLSFPKSTTSQDEPPTAAAAVRAEGIFPQN